MKKNTFLLVLTFSFLLSQTACDNNDNLLPGKEKTPIEDMEEDIEDNNPLLPAFIKSTYVLNADPFHDNIDSVVFTYDDMNRLIRRSATTSMIYHDTKEERIGYQSILHIDYNINGTITTVDSIYYNLGEENEALSVNVRTYHRPEPDASQVDITLNDNFKESIALENDKAVKRYKITWYPSAGTPHPYSSGTYKYDKKGNITSVTDIPQVKYEETFAYDNHHGVFKNLFMMPQWLIVDILGTEYLHNNVTKKYSVFSGESRLSSYNEYKYNSDGYPVEINDRPAPDMIGYWGSRSTVQYIPYKPLEITCVE